MSIKEKLAPFLERCRVHPDFLQEEITQPNQRGATGDAPLHLAARFGTTDDIRALVDWGADINMQGDIGNAALHHAAIWKRTDVVELLLELGADPTIRNDFGETAADCARNNRDPKTEALLRRGSR